MNEPTPTSSSPADPANAAAVPDQITATAHGAQAWLDAFDERIGRLASNGRSWLGPLRREAIERVAEHGFPAQRDEEWRNTPLRDLLAARYTPAGAATVDGPVSARLDELDLEGIETHRLVFINGRLDAERTRIGALPEGVRVMSLAQAIDAEPALVEPHLARYATPQAHAFVALNTAFMTDGALIHLPEGAQLETPVHIVHFQVADDSDDVTPAVFPRCLIVAGAGSAAHVIETYAGLPGAAYLTSAVTEAVVAVGADIRWTKRQEESSDAFHVGRFNGRQVGSSTLATHNVALGGRLVRNEIEIVIDAEECETLLDGLYMASGRQHIENRTRLDHAKPNCHSEERYKGILDDASTGVFAGRIYVHQDAQKTDAFQENSCLLLSRDATVFTQPQLEIFADDVKCTHGATVGELDESQLFYLRARGLDPVEAHGILTYGYANEIVESIGIEPLQAQIETLIRARVRESHARRAAVLSGR